MSPSAVSPLALPFPDMPELAGLGLATTATGMRYTGRDDALLAVASEGATCAGVLTRSAMPGVPVDWCRDQVLPQGTARALLVNAGNANVFTGEAGIAAHRASVRAAAQALGCSETAILTGSTGVIGEAPAMDPLVAAVPGLARDATAPNATTPWRAAAQAISTTDTFPKGAHATAEIAGRRVQLCGIAKGSGMIAPDMATMLAYVFTDAHLPADLLQACLNPAVAASMNCVTVDSDSSTSDMALLLATGAADNPVPAGGATAAELADFRRALQAVCDSLAEQIARDGEGAEKLITVRVSGASDDAAARRIALSVANSPLVKTAVAGEDANWGRIVMAVGKAGERADRDRTAIWIGGHPVARNGAAVPGYDEAPVAAHLRGQEVTIAVDVGIGDGRARVWSCDLTHRYIDINGDYRS